MMPFKNYWTRNHEWINVLSALSPLIKGMGLKSLIQDDELDNNGLNFANCDIHCQLIVRAVEKLLELKSADIKAVQNLLKGLLNRKTMVGAFCELAAYDWLMRYDFGVKIQISLDKNSVLGKSGSIVDGQLSLLSGQAYFDVKSFGFHGQMALRLKESLELLIPGKSVSIEGSWDVSISDFGQLLNDRNSIAQELRGRLLASRYRRHPSLGGLPRLTSRGRVDRLMTAIGRVEAFAVGRIGLRLPFGLSIMLLVEKRTD